MATQAQAHIHLDPGLEGAPEFSPTNKYTALVPDVRAAIAHVAMEYAVDATLMTHKVTDSDTGLPVVSEARRYRLKVTRAELDTLIADLGKLVYFVPNYHPDDSEDHRSYRTAVQFKTLTDIRSRESADLATYYCTIELQIS